MPTSGLTNYGATCYVNTALQLMCHNKPLVDLILSVHHHQQGDDNNTDAFARDLKTIISDVCLRNTKVVDTRNFLNTLHHVFTRFGLAIYEQNDVDEFMCLFIHQICKSFPSDNPTVHQPSRRKSTTAVNKLIEKLNAQWAISHKHDYSIITDQVYGQLLSQVECKECNNISHSPETFLTIPLSFCPGIETYTLEKMMTSFVGAHNLNDFHCNVCHNNNCRARKVTKFWKLPCMLLISFKRFDSTGNKLTHPVALPYTLDISDHCMYDEDRHYELRGIACHTGSMSSGHYYALCYNESDKSWMCYDDDSCEKISSYKEVPSNRYYMAMYSIIEN